MTTAEEKRKYPRVKTDNLLSYVIMDDDNNETDQAMGKALDISQGGLLLEGHIPIQSKTILISSFDTNNELMEIRGRVVYCKEADNGKFQTGVEFIESSEIIRRFVINLVKVYSLQKER